MMNNGSAYRKKSKSEAGATTDTAAAVYPTKYFSRRYLDKFASSISAVDFDARSRVGKFSYHKFPQRPAAAAEAYGERQRIAYESWCSTADARRRAQKQLEKERERAAERERSAIAESRRILNNTLVSEWHERNKKKIEKNVELDVAGSHGGMSKKNNKKVFKKALSFEAWLAMKNEEQKSRKSLHLLIHPS